MKIKKYEWEDLFVKTAWIEMDGDFHADDSYYDSFDEDAIEFNTMEIDGDGYLVMPL